MNVKNSIHTNFFYVFLFGILLTLVFALGQGANVGAANMSKFNPGNIMSDAVMSNSSSMSESQIQTFLRSKNACNDTNIAKAKQHPNMVYNIKNGKFVCLAEERFNGQSAAQILLQAGKDYGINPQVLIVLLEKEQSLITDTWPNSNIQYRSAMGYGCPDTAACDTQYYGFKNQVRNAANFFRAHLDDNPCWSKPHIPGTKKAYWKPVNNCNGSVASNSGVKFHPNDSCGATAVNIQNRATSGLYSYTPYQPNKAALNAGYGNGNSCSSYGNRNFWGLFNDWFGDTNYAVKGAINSRYIALGGKSGLGMPTQNEVMFAPNQWYQCFQRGCIIGSSETGFWESKGSIRTRWGQLGYQSSPLGLPTGPELYSGGAYRQAYQRGLIIGNSKTGFWEAKGAILNRWAKLGYQGGSMGIPSGPEVYAGGTGYYQKFTGGYIIGKAETGFWDSRGAIRTHWARLGYQSGNMGYPTGSIQKQDSKTYYQQYQNGRIYHKSPNTNWVVK